MYERHGGTTTWLSTGSTGGNGAFDIFFAAASADGTRAFFETDEQLTAADTDAAFDVYERAGGATTLISTGSPGGNGAHDVTFHAISRDGSRVFFETDEQLLAADTDSETDVYERSAGTTSLVSTGPAGGNGAFFVAFGGVSADGTRVVFETDEQLVAADSDATYDVYQRAGGTTTLISTGPSGGNGNFDAGYREISADGTHVFFQTQEQLVTADTDAQTDVYGRSGGTTTLISTGPAGGNGALPAAFEGSSADGTRVFLSTSESLTAADTDTRRDIYRRAGATTELVSTGPGGGNGAFDADFMGASLDGSNVYVRTEESLVAADTDTGCAAGQGPQCRDVYEYAGGTTSLVSTGPAGGNGAFDASFAAVSRDGKRVFFDTREQMTSGDTDASVDVYERFGGSTTLLSTGPRVATELHRIPVHQRSVRRRDARLLRHARVADGERHRYLVRHLRRRRRGVSDGRWRLAPRSRWCRHTRRARPRTARTDRRSRFGRATLRWPRRARPPWAPPTRSAVGPTSWASSAMRWSSEPGPPEIPTSAITSSLSDVRCRPAGARCGTANAAGPADYTGEVRAAVALRMTDRWNAVAAGGGTDAGTGQSVSLAWSFPCAPTASTSTGSTCTLRRRPMRSCRAGAGHQAGDLGMDRSRSTTAGRTVTRTPPAATRCSRCRASSFHRQSGPCRAC